MSIQKMFIQQVLCRILLDISSIKQVQDQLGFRRRGLLIISYPWLWSF